MKQWIEKNWTLWDEKEEKIPAKVPGDITTDLYRAGRIEDPMWGLNHLELDWIWESDFVYETTFDVEDSIWEQDEVILGFDGIDVFAEITLNGTCIGVAENMFRAYTYEVKELLKKKDNQLTVRMLSTKRKMAEIDTGEYWGIFNTERLLIRKAQCHFGWDWAPNMPGYGIYRKVWLEGRSKDHITEVSYRAYASGKVQIKAGVSYDVRPWTDHYGVPIHEISPEVLHDTLVYRLAKQPGEALTEDNAYVMEQPVDGRKKFANFILPDAKLWWPSGYGEQPLYEYSVSLMRDGKVIDFREGRLAFREVELKQEPISEKRLECKIVINGMPVFAKGSNWVPMECFTGEVTREKYARLLQEAKDANMNMIRVWGGGVYEDDAFYDLCDELGLMVWQDMMFACADIPEERLDFMENVEKEISYQIVRLRNHPSIVLWNGGNEKVGALCKQESHGDRFLEIYLRGMISHLDDTRPYVKQSPFGDEELANDELSGDIHRSSFEEGIGEGTDHYRDLVSEKQAAFISESSLMGPGTAESYRRIFPEEKLWPMNEYWDDRLMDNPYAAVYFTFANLQKKYAEAMYGESHSLEEFVAKGMTVHAEALRTELEFARINKGTTWGFMNWMYNDIWPSGTWSLVDYYGEPKQAYYQMKRSFEPVLVTFAQNHEKETALFVVNDTKDFVEGTLRYGVKDLSGNICWEEEIEVSVEENGLFSVTIIKEWREVDTYLYVEGTLNEKPYETVYSHGMWCNYNFDSAYTYEVVSKEGGMEVTVRAERFAKGITLRLPQNENYTYSDNYFDLQAGQEKTIFIAGAIDVPVKELVVTDFAKETR